VTVYASHVVARWCPYLVCGAMHAPWTCPCGSMRACLSQWFALVWFWLFQCSGVGVHVFADETIIALLSPVSLALPVASTISYLGVCDVAKLAVL
jgi:hypothetical protein